MENEHENKEILETGEQRVNGRNEKTPENRDFDETANSAEISEINETKVNVSDALEPNMELNVDEALNQLAEATSSMMAAKFGVLEPGHPMSVYVNQLAEPLLKKENTRKMKVQILVNYKGPNAFALPNGDVFVSLDLLDLCEHEQEVQAVLGHEFTHVLRGHSRKILETAQKRLNFLDSIMNEFGIRRFAEYEADIRPVIELLDANGINAYGAFMIFKKLHAHFIGKGDMVHGDNLERIMNLYWTSKLKDLEHLDPGNLTRLEKYWSSLLEEKERFFKPGVLLEEDDVTNSAIHERKLKEAKRANILGCKDVINDLYERRADISRQLKNSDGRNYRLDQELTNLNQIITILEKRFLKQLGVDKSVNQELFKGLLYFFYFDFNKGRNFARDFVEGKEDPDMMPMIEFDDKDHFLEVVNEFAFVAASKSLGIPATNYHDYLQAVAINCIRQGFFFEGDSFDLFGYELFIDEFLDFLDLNTDYNKSLLLFEAMCEMDDENIVEFLHMLLSYEKIVPREIQQKLKELDLLETAMEDSEINDYLLGSKAAIRDGLFAKVDDETPAERAEFYKSRINILLDIFADSSAEIDVRLEAFSDLWEELQSLLDVKNKTVYEEREELILQKEELEFIFIRLAGIANEFKKVLNETHDIALLEKFSDDSYALANHLLILIFIYSGEKRSNLGLEAYMSLAIQMSNDYEDLNEHLKPYIEFLNPIFPRNHEELFGVLEVLKDFQQETQSKGGSQEKSNLANSYMEASVYHFLRIQYEQDGDIEALLDGLKRYLPYIDHRKINFAYVVDFENIQKLFIEQKEKFFEILAKREFDKEKTEDLRAILSVCKLLNNGIMARRLQKIISERILENAGFDEAYKFFADKDGDGTLSDPENFHYLSQVKATTHDEIEKITNNALNRLDKDDYKAEGGLVVMEQLMKFVDKTELLKLFLTTRRDDTDLKTLLLGMYESASMDYSEKQTVLESPQRFLEILYRLDEKYKYILLQKLMMGKKGTLMKVSDRRVLIEYLMKNEIGEDDSEVNRILKEVIEALLFTGEPELIFFMLFPTLLKKFLIPPEDYQDWKKAINLKIDNEFADDICKGFMNTHNLEREIKERRAELQEFLDQSERDSLVFEEMIERKLVKLFEEELRVKVDERIDPIELIVNIMQTLGSIGVRFLQIAGQYLDLTPEMEEKFKKVYDRMSGQFKLTAHNTVCSEWSGFREQFEGIGEPIGGGSMVTVYKTRDIEGGDWVLKVTNPSFNFFYKTVFKALKDLFQELNKQDEKYGIALKMLEDIRKWVESDYNYEGFRGRDCAFFEKWNGFRAEGNDYEIKVPRLYGGSDGVFKGSESLAEGGESLAEMPESKKFKIEEYVEGVNLNNLEELKQRGHDVKQIFRLIGSHFLAMLMDGQMHSNIHQGNFRITDDGKIAILDRNFYLELDEKDKIFISDMYASGGDSAKMAQLLCEYLGVNGRVMKRLKKEFEKAACMDDAITGKTDPLNTLTRMLIILHEENVDVPLKLTLLQNNLNALNDMARKVGIETG